MQLNHYKNTSASILILLLGFLFSCNSDTKSPDVSNIDLEVKIQRFEQELFAVKQESDLNKLRQQYPDVLQLYSNKVIGLGDSDDSDYMVYLNKFLTDSTMNQVADSVAKKFPTLDKEEKELTNAFKYLKYYFPEKPVPNCYSQISGFNQSIVVAQNLIGISLDKYLGKDCAFYSYLGTPMYARENMIPERIVQDVVLAYALTEFPFTPLKDDLISNMIYQGKIRYFLQAMMPQKSEADVMKYSQKELEWCEENDELMWGYIIEQKHLFTSEYRTVIKYINDGPFTPGMPQESPSRTGIWIGWQIVKEHMAKHPEVTINQLMTENDYAAILRESAYQP
ncbi:gliding motility lipoprotein GldB [Labilibaculum euxinus]|uniref:Gliding motility lipoprotein GldB n=1 Tax=Labilibaculum euxinus TaxID=2686357 RepID=A0A7M4DAI4_9BACT|nr:gliding motility lipoprotein GldB [Labilibaculum euxinus]MUP39663.1 gliding motility lipoprotein GldB [Labilibaculum euxinus]MVB08868.1 gliding motility lipoprotein GldB [Labilibaculum euxinus]